MLQLLLTYTFYNKVSIILSNFLLNTSNYHRETIPKNAIHECPTTGYKLPLRGFKHRAKYAKSSEYVKCYRDVISQKPTTPFTSHGWAPVSSKNPIGGWGLHTSLKGCNFL